MCLLCICVLPASLLALFSVETCWCFGCLLTLTWVKTRIFAVNIKTQHYLREFIYMWDISLWSVCAASDTFSWVKGPRRFSNFVPLMKCFQDLLPPLGVYLSECAGVLRLSHLQHTPVCVVYARVAKVFFFFFFSPTSLCVCVCVCSESFSGSLPGLRAWLREHLKPVHSGCEVWGRDGDLLKLQTMCISVPLFVCVYVFFCASPSSLMFIGALTSTSGLLL